MQQAILADPDIYEGAEGDNVPHNAVEMESRGEVLHGQAGLLCIEGPSALAAAANTKYLDAWGWLRLTGVRGRSG